MHRGPLTTDQFRSPAPHTPCQKADIIEAHHRAPEVASGTVAGKASVPELLSPALRGRRRCISSVEWLFIRRPDRLFSPGGEIAEIYETSTRYSNVLTSTGDRQAPH